MPPQPLNDGMTFDGATKPAGHFPTITFRYRPAYPEHVGDYLQANKSDGKLALKAMTKLLTRYLVSWDVEKDGQPVPINADNLGKVPYPVLFELVNIVSGYGDEAEEDAKN